MNISGQASRTARIDRQNKVRHVTDGMTVKCCSVGRTKRLLLRGCLRNTATATTHHRSAGLHSHTYAIIVQVL